jgi:hypothetical protein
MRNKRRKDGKAGTHDRDQRKNGCQPNEIRVGQENLKEKMEANRKSDAESRELEELTEYSDIFAMGCNDYGWTDRVYHHTDTGEA